MTARRFLSRADALRRMRSGDLPTQGGGYSSALYFDDGARTSGPTGWRMVRDGLIDRPLHSSVSSRYTLHVDDVRCAWFAHCTNVATGTTPHPVLGDVPTCDRCASFATGGAK